jgi:hypothetical protein
VVISLQELLKHYKKEGNEHLRVRLNYSSTEF